MTANYNLSQGQNKRFVYNQSYSNYNLRAFDNDFMMSCADRICAQCGDNHSFTGNFADVAIEGSKEILYYRDGVYIHGGDVLIEKEAEQLYGYKLSSKHLVEIKGHIMRMTYHKHAEIDADINIVNLKNGLYNIQTGEFKDHSPDYLSVNQKPIIYNPNAKPNLFEMYLKQVLYPDEIRTAIELMAYTFCRDNIHEIIAILFGYGANGKSVFTGLLTALHGSSAIIFND